MYVQVPIASIVFITLVGFCMGPMFASGVIILTRLLPVELHVAAVSFVASTGRVGAALVPFGIGTIIKGFGIGVFRFAVSFLSILALLFCIPLSQQQPIMSHTSSHEELEGDVEGEEVSLM